MESAQYIKFVRPVRRCTMSNGPQFPVISCTVQVTNPDEEGQSLALMYAYEQGRQQDGVDARVSAQAMGPNDTYICQTSTDKTIFWGDRNKLALGACFKPAPARSYGDVPKELINEVWELQVDFARLVA